MPYDFSISVFGDYIRVEVSGDRIKGRELKDIAVVWSAVANKCRETDIRRVLAVLQLSGNVPTIQSYDIVMNAASFGWSKYFHLAIVDLNEVSRDQNLFTETVAVNRGYTIKIFDNEQDAGEWLLDLGGIIRLLRLELSTGIPRVYTAGNKPACCMD